MLYMYILQISMQNEWNLKSKIDKYKSNNNNTSTKHEWNLKSTNIRATTIIQVQNMNVMLNMKDINNISANITSNTNLF